MNLIKQALATTIDNEDKIIKRISKSMIIVKQKYYIIIVNIKLNLSKYSIK